MPDIAAMAPAGAGNTCHSTAAGAVDGTLGPVSKIHTAPESLCEALVCVWLCCALSTRSRLFACSCPVVCVCAALCLQAERRVQEQRTRKGTQPFFIGGGGRSRDDEEEEEEREDPRAARARAQAERRAAQEQAKQEAASARAQEQVGV